jgi:hypothetical protein
VTLPPETRLLVWRLAELRGVPATQVITDIVVDAAPVLLQVVDAMEVARTLQKAKAEALRAKLHKAEVQATGAADAALAVLERLVAQEGSSAPAGEASGASKRSRKRKR